MTLSPGARLGPYEIVAVLGAGGMGEVYRARDTRLERTVAIKVLRGPLAADPQRRQRFEREARAIASLSDPHICHLNDVGQQDGLDYLVMEHLEGETLAARLAKGPLPMAVALRHAVEIAGALASAHRQGVVHRDLKPGNIMLTRAGAKILDFGLAKWLSPVVFGSGPEGGAEDASALPTGTRPLSQDGAILGTLPYMAPEQLAGKEVDGRADLFAFGAVLYEMLTGKRAFEGTSSAGIVAAVMTSDPPTPTTLRPDTPAGLERIVRACLAKDPEDRWQNAGDLTRELRFLADGGAPEGSIAPPRTRLQRFAVPLAAVALLVCAGMLPMVLSHLREASPVVEPVRFSLAPPDGFEMGDSLAISPDGRHVAFIARSQKGERSLWLRSLDSLAARSLAGTEEAEWPFWSPDNRFLGFAARGELAAIDVSSGAVRTLASVPSNILGGTWSPEGVLLIGTQGPLLRVPATGGLASAATTLDASAGETEHLFPQFLPDGRRFLYQALIGPREIRANYVGSLDSTVSRRLTDGRSPVRFALPGYLLLRGEAGLMAQSFDPETLELEGEPWLVATRADAPFLAPRRLPLSTSSTGALVYASASRSTRLTWTDRQGRKRESIGPPADYHNVSLSPDDLRVAVEIRDDRTGLPDIWFLDALRGTPSRFTLESRDYDPIWSPDGRSIVFASNREGSENIYVRPADASAPDRPLVRSGVAKHPNDWSRDGRFVVYDYHSAARAQDLWIVPADGSGEPRPLVEGPADESQAQFSPDGRWLAYQSHESGRPQVVVQSFPGPGGKWLISPDGGYAPRWRSDGKELFYIAPDRKLMAVAIKAGVTFEASAPTALFQTDIERTGGPLRYDVAADGQRFLLRTPDESHRPSITVVLNWPAALRKN